MTKKKSTARLDIDALSPETLLSPFDAARFLGLCVRSLERYRQERLGKISQTESALHQVQGWDLQDFCASRAVDCAKGERDSADSRA